MQKRYQYFAADGIKFTKWFILMNDKYTPIYQIGTDKSKTKLLNEYK